MDNQEHAGKKWQVGKALLLWKRFTSGSINRKIFGAGLTIAVFTGVVKAAAVIKALLIARRLGTGGELDAYYIAVLATSFATSLIAGSLSIALIPTFVRARECEGAEAAQTLFSTLLCCTIGLLLITSLLIVAAAPLYLPFVASGFNAQKLTLTFDLICLMAIVVLLSGIANIFAAVLNATERFALPAISPIITPISFIFFLLLDKPGGVFSLAAAMVCGAALEMLVLGAALKWQGLSLFPKWHGFNSHLREIKSQFSPRVAGQLLRSGSNIVDQSMAAMLPSGSVAALNYGNSVVSSLRGMIGAALGSAVIPFFSRMVARQDWKGLRHTLRRYLLLIFTITVPITVAVFLFSEPLIRILFQRGSFSPSDTLLVSQIQAFYVLQIPFAVANNLTGRLLSSLLKAHILMWMAAVNLLLNIGLNILFIRKFGVAGIALSTSCTFLVSFSFLGLYSLRSLRRHETSSETIHQ